MNATSQVTVSNWVADALLLGWQQPAEVACLHQTQPGSAHLPEHIVALTGLLSVTDPETHSFTTD